MAKQNKALTITGWVMSGLLSAFLILGACWASTHMEEAQKGFVDQFGYPKDVFVPLVIVELSCLVLYLIPQTSVLGAVLLTGYFGGAVATHVRVHENAIAPVLAGVLFWLALYLRDPRVRSVLPLRRAGA